VVVRLKESAFAPCLLPSGLPFGLIHTSQPDSAHPLHAPAVMAISQYSLDQDPNQVLHGLPLEHDPNQQQEGDEAISFVLPHWTAKRHLTGGNPGSRKESQQDGGEDVPGELTATGEEEEGKRGWLVGEGHPVAWFVLADGPDVALL
jgi:hypothetical protein